MLGHFLGSPFAAQQIKIDRACNLPAQALELLALVRLGGDARMQRETADLAGVAFQRAVIGGDRLRRRHLAPGLRAGDDAVGDRTHPRVQAVVAAGAVGQKGGFVFAFEPALARWYPETLAKIFNSLHVIRDRLTIHCDSLSIALSGVHAKNSQAMFFVDPPYTAGGKKAGKRLYTFSGIDHSALFDLCANVTGEFVMTYDDAHEVHALAQACGFSSRLIAMKNTHHAEMSELVIGRNLSWLDAKPLPSSGWQEAK